MRPGLLALLLLALAGCKQPLGGRCQTNGDCESGICSIAEPRTCREGSGEEIVTDAAPPDAKVDARPDGAVPDSGPADATVPDAIVIDAVISVDAEAPDAM